MGAPPAITIKPRDLPQSKPAEQADMAGVRIPAPSEPVVDYRGLRCWQGHPMPPGITGGGPFIQVRPEGKPHRIPVSINPRSVPVRRYVRKGHPRP